MRGCVNFGLDLRAMLRDARSVHGVTCRALRPAGVRWIVMPKTGRALLSIACLAIATLSLIGCSLPLADLPSPMGLPADAPARPSAPPDYPSVNDQAPVRQDTTLSDDERKRLEKELELARERQKGTSRQN